MRSVLALAAAACAAVKEDGPSVRVKEDVPSVRVKEADATKTEVKAAECDNTCEWARDGFCDDTRTNGECALGTDCQDCGPASSGNYSTYDDDEWWDDDEGGNWYRRPRGARVAAARG